MEEQLAIQFLLHGVKYFELAEFTEYLHTPREIFGTAFSRTEVIRGFG